MKYAKQTQPPDARYAKVIEQLESHHGNSELYATRQFAKGKSGAYVYKVELVPRERGAKHPSRQPFILKLDDIRMRKAPDEACRHERAQELAARFIPRLIYPVIRDPGSGLLAMQFEMAGKGLRECRNADELLSDDALAAFWSQLSMSLLEQFGLSECEHVSDKECLDKWLDFRLNEQLREFVREKTNGKDWFEDRYCCHPLLNPLWFYDHEADDHEEMRLCGLQHNDLHCANVIVNAKDHRDFWILDFAMSERQSYLGYDHAYFELSLLQTTLMREAPDPIQRHRRLFAILEMLDADRFFTDEFQPKRIFHPHLGPMDGGLLNCLHAGRRQAQTWGDGTGRKEALERQMVLGRIAAGLVWSQWADVDRDLAFYYSAWYAKRYREYDRDQHEPKSGVAGSEDGLLSLENGSRLRAPRLPLGFSSVDGPLKQECAVHALAWSPVGDLAIARADGEVRLWTGPGSSGHKLKRHDQRVNALAWSPDGRRLATGSDDRTIRLWDTQKLAALPPSLPSGHVARIETMAWSSSSERPGLFASGSDDRDIIVWDLDQDPPGRLGTLKGHRKEVMSCAWAPGRPVLASAGNDGRCLIWDFSGPGLPPEPRHELEWGQSLVCAVWSPDGRLLVTGSFDSRIQVWDPELGVHLVALEGHGKPISAVTFSPEGSLLASKSLDGTVRIWRRFSLGDDTSWETVAVLSEPASKAYPVDIAFHYHKEQSRLLLATLGDNDESVRVWQLEGFASHPPGDGHRGEGVRRRPAAAPDDAGPQLRRA